MSPDEYVSTVIRSYELPDGPNSPAYQAAHKLADLVKPWAGRCLISTSPAGSWAKGTRIRGSTDLDLLILLGPRTRGTPEKIYHSLFAFLKRQGYSPAQRNVSVSIEYHGLLVDLIPARQEWGSGDRVTMFGTERNRPITTNLGEHARLVTSSGRADDIRALKVWRDTKNLRFPSFYLELVVLDALRHRAHKQPAANLTGSLEYLRDSFAGTPFRDPASIENKVSTELTEHEQMAIAAVAGQSLKEKDWSRVIH